VEVLVLRWQLERAWKLVLVMPVSVVKVEGGSNLRDLELALLSELETS
jgi:hypothetical protein